LEVKPEMKWYKAWAGLPIVPKMSVIP